MPASRRAFGQRVRELRTQLGMSQEDLAEAAHLHRTYVVGVETGQRNLSRDAIFKIADGLRCNPASLFSTNPQVQAVEQLGPVRSPPEGCA